jgi:aconitate hydratase
VGAHTDEATEKNTIITSFNRNFAKRNDGNPNTMPSWPARRS